MIATQEDIVIVDKETNKALINIKGWSDESKPTEKLGDYIIADCSTFMEMDTGNLYAFKESSGTWVAV